MQRGGYGVGVDVYGELMGKCVLIIGVVSVGDGGDVGGVEFLEGFYVLSSQGDWAGVYC